MRLLSWMYRPRDGLLVPLGPPRYQLLVWAQVMDGRWHKAVRRATARAKLSTNVVQRSVRLRTSNILSLAHTHKKVCALVDLKMTFFCKILERLTRSVDVFMAFVTQAVIL